MSRAHKATLKRARLPVMVEGEMRTPLVPVSLYKRLFWSDDSSRIPDTSAQGRMCQRDAGVKRDILRLRLHSRRPDRICTVYIHLKCIHRPKNGKQTAITLLAQTISKPQLNPLAFKHLTLN